MTNLHLTDLWAGRIALPWTRFERGRTRVAEPPVAVEATGAPAGEPFMQMQRLAGIGALAAGVAQELANPLSMITATCNSLLEELEGEDPDRKALVDAVELIERQAFRCARVVEVLGNYAYRAGSAWGQEYPDGPAVAVTSPAAIVGDALVMVEQQLRRQGRVTVAVDLQESLGTIFCDHHRISQVLMILLLNARDAMQPAGGTARVRFWKPSLALEKELAERLPAAMVPDGSAWGEPDLFAFSVTDSGIGLGPAVQARLFEPLFTTKPHGQGAGMGLYIARSIIEQHGGCLFGENNPDGGAIFTAVLPRRRPVSGIQ